MCLTVTLSSYSGKSSSVGMLVLEVNPAFVGTSVEFGRSSVRKRLQILNIKILTKVNFCLERQKT